MHQARTRDGEDSFGEAIEMAWLTLCLVLNSDNKHQTEPMHGDGGCFNTRQRQDRRQQPRYARLETYMSLQRWAYRIGVASPLLILICGEIVGALNVGASDNRD